MQALSPNVEDEYAELNIRKPLNKELTFFNKTTNIHYKLSTLLDSSIVLRYAFVTCVTVFVIGLKILLLPPFDTPYLFVITAIIINALYAGLSAGIISTVITLVIANILFLEPQYAIKVNRDTLIHAVIYLFQGIFISYLIERERITRKILFEQSKEYQITLASIGDAVITTDTKGIITLMNRVAEKITGWTNSEATGKKIETVFNIRNEKTNRRVVNPVSKVLKKKEIVNLANHTTLITKSGKTVPIDDSAAPIKDNRGNLIGVVLIFRDITQRKILDQRKDDFISIVSHELKTPVTSIKLFVQLLKRKSQAFLNQEFSDVLNKIDNQLGKLSELVGDFLDLSRIQSGKLKYRKEFTYIDPIAQNTITELRQIYPDSDIALKGTISKKMVIDKDRIKQVLINLITNAIKYSNNKPVLVELGNNRECAIIKVHDQGMGIPKDQQHKIFDRFYQINTNKAHVYPGLGLGLYICSEIIKNHEGKIWVESKAGKGSTFQFMLPFSKR